ncbi:hypothetical protein JCM8097_008421 [Rhodosporidiobolus ruineniae]
MRTLSTRSAASSLLLTRSSVEVGGGHPATAGARGQLAWQTGSRRSFFGLGEIVGVLTNPSEVLRSLSESKRLLEEARQELQEAKERSQIPASHTFSPLPGFFDRPNEIKAIERCLSGVPTFTVLFGASSVGKTALLRQVLSSDKYHVLHFDLRIAGFADLASLYFSLSTQLESYFASIPDLLGREYGWGEFEKESWAFKHDRLEVQKRLQNGGEVKTSDVAHLLELFQSALLSYWNFKPMTEAQRKRAEQKQKELEQAKKEGKDSASSSKSASSSSSSKTPAKPSPTKTDPVLYASHHANDPTEARLRQGAAVPRPKQEQEPVDDLLEARSLRAKQEAEEKKVKEDEARKKEEEDGKEDEPQPPPKRVPVFFLDEGHKLPALIQSEDTMKTFLDALLVLTKQDRLLHVIQATSDPFFLHWLRQMNIMQHCAILSVGDVSKSEAKKYFDDILLPHVPEKLRHKIPFDELYNVFGGKLAHLSDYVGGEFVNSDGEITPKYSSHCLQALSLLNLQLIHSAPSSSGDDTSARGFQIYSSLASASPHSAPSPYGSSEDSGPAFHPRDLLTVMQRLQPGAEDELPYFPLCRELGARAVDGMIRGRVLELRWSRTITEEGDLEEKRKRRDGQLREGRREKAERLLPPVVVPTTPVVRWAMGEVLKEYEGEGWLEKLETRKET